MFFEMFTKPMKLHVLLHLASIAIVFTGFDLKMSKGHMDTSTLVINYLNDYWTPMHVIIDLFKFHETTRLSMARKL